MARSARNASWGYLALEAGLIVLSVLLAFGIQEWRQGQRDAASAERAREAIRREIVANRAEVENLLEVHRHEIERIRQDSSNRLMVNWQTSVLQNSAWETAQSTGAAAHLDFDVAEAAAVVRQVQAGHADFQRTVGEMLYQTILAGGADIGATLAERKGALVPMLINIATYEASLLRAYDDALAALNGEAPSSDSSAALAGGASR